MSKASPKYEQLANQTQDLLHTVGQPGDRLMSIRDYASRERVSISTAQRAYELLELRGLIESRPRSGFYLSGSQNIYKKPLPRASLEIPLAQTRLEWLNSESSVAWHAHKFSAYFASGMPDVSLSGVSSVNRIVRQLTRKNCTSIHHYGPILGAQLLREQLVQRMASAGVQCQPESLIATSGGQEALFLAINTCTSAGDLIAVESPCYHGIIGAIQQSGRQLIEIPTDPVNGIDLDSLELALENLPIKAVVLSTSTQNPLGFAMDDSSRQSLVQLANAHDIYLIEDDVYGELVYDRVRSRCLRAFDTEDRVLTCGSVSKTLAPGFRVGWLETGRWMESAKSLKRVMSMRTPMLSQLAVAQHMADGHYDRHLRMARTTYAQRGKALQKAVRSHFPSQCRISRPTGGFILWIELPKECSGMDLASFALSQDIALSPGSLFSHNGHYSQCIRLSYSRYIPEVHESSIATLGDWVTKHIR